MNYYIVHCRCFLTDTTWTARFDDPAEMWEYACLAIKRDALDWIEEVT